MGIFKPFVSFVKKTQRSVANPKLEIKDKPATKFNSKHTIHKLYF